MTILTQCGLVVGSMLAVLGCGDAATPGRGDAAVGVDARSGTAADADPAAPDAALARGRVFDHRHTDLTGVSADCFAQIISSPDVFHYGHRSHGSQLIVGAESIAGSTATMPFAAAWCAIPEESSALKMWDGMADDNLVRADDYWASQTGLDTLRGILAANPQIRYSMWAWSFEISSQTEADIRRYLEAMSSLESEFPEVTFIYMTGPAQGTDGALNRFERNKQIRDYCAANNKVLYDFEDLDAWWNSEYNTVGIGGVRVPMEHPHYSLDTPGNTEYEWTHTTRDSTENKARAMWGMMAHFTGCAF